MLQQTRVEAAIPYYERFLAALPDLPALAQAPDELLLKLWEGLGYYSRVRNMKKAAQICMERFGGRLPDTPEELETLPGIGHYTAGAIASMAYGRQVCAVDGNLCRVYARLFLLEDDMTQTAGKRKVEELIRRDMADDMGEMNQALMDIGAGICLPGAAARCALCPLADLCMAYRKGRTAELPSRKPPVPRRVEEKTVLLCCENGEILLRRRPSKGLLAGMTEFLLTDGIAEPPKDAVPLGKHKHVFSHLEWHMTGYYLPYFPQERPEDCFTVPLRELLETQSFPSAFKPYLRWLKEQILSSLPSE